MNNDMIKSGKILLYQNDSEKEFVSVVFQEETFWLTQAGMAELFDCTSENIIQHLRNIYVEEELSQQATTKKFLVVRKEGTRNVRRKLEHYNLDAIIAVGYRVNSKKATKFRQWATRILKEYIQKGFVLNDDMLKNGLPFGKDYFNELLERIREIRAREELIKKSPMYLNNVALTMTRTVKLQKLSTHLFKINCISLLQAKLLRS